jgi:hypothetical protein
MVFVSQFFVPMSDHFDGYGIAQCLIYTHKKLMSLSVLRRQCRVARQTTSLFEIVQFFVLKQNLRFIVKMRRIRETIVEIAHRNLI